MSTSSLRDWIEEQSARLRQPDINLLIDLFVTSTNDQEVKDLAFGLLGESPQIKSFVKELCDKRQRLKLGSSFNPGSASSQQGGHQQQQKHGVAAAGTKLSNTGLVGQNTILPSSSLTQQSSLSSYSQPVVLSHVNTQQHTQDNDNNNDKNNKNNKKNDKNDKNDPKMKSKIDPKISFANQAAQGGNNNNTNNTSVQNPKPNHSTSLNSGIFFTADDAGVLDIAQLMHKDTKDQKKLNKSENHTVTVKDDPIFPTLGSKGATKGSNKDIDFLSMMSQTNDDDDLAAQLGLNFTNKFNVQDKRKKNTKNDGKNDKNDKNDGKNDKNDKNDPNPEPNPLNTTMNDAPEDNVPYDPYQDIVFYPKRNTSRPKCDCMARKHKFYANCNSCGRIFCLFEGEGDCYYCGSYIINYDLNKEMISLYNRSHDDGKKHSKNQKEKKTSVQITSHTRKALHSNPSDSIQNDIELLDMLTRDNPDYTKELNTNGHGTLTVPNEIFFEKMETWTENAKGYYFRTNKRQDKIGMVNGDGGGDNGAEQRVSSTEIRSNSAYGANASSSSLSESERVAVGLEKALAFRNILIKRETEKAKRTKVIDEQSDYYDFETNIWLDKDEREKKKQIAVQVDDLIESENQKRTFTVDIDEKTGQIKQSFTKTDFSMKGHGIVGTGNDDLIKRATNIVDKRAEREDKYNGQPDDSNVVKIEHHGKSFSQKELQQRREFHQIKRRVDVERQQAEMEAQKKLEEEKKNSDNLNNKNDSSRKKKSKKGDETSSLSTDSQHLSGRALLVFNTLKDTLKPDMEALKNNKDSDDVDVITTSWASRLNMVNERYDEEYEFYRSNPEQYLAQGFVPLYNDGEMNADGGVRVENATDSGCG